MKPFPTDTQCPVCQKIFQQPQRKQGGGRLSIYCAPKCRALDWVHGNGAKRKASVLKYDQRPENIERKKWRSKQQKFRKYGITEKGFLDQLVRQHSFCYGCGDTIDEFSAQIDHDHTTGRVRGLLCTSCNWSLGHLKDKRETCYRLAAYLNYDRTKTGIYLIGSLRNSEIPGIAKRLREEGFFVWDEWYSAGPEADDHFQKYHMNKGYTYSEALKSEVAQHIFYFDKAHLDLCDYGILVYPAGRSCHLELGYMAARGKKTFILLDSDPERYDIMPQFCSGGIYKNITDLIQGLKNGG